MKRRISLILKKPDHLAKKKKRRKKATEKIVVESTAYGRHLRAPRGSKSRVTLNAAMKAHGRRLLKSNVPAKLIMDALAPYRKDFKGGMLWQRLVAHFAAQAKNGIDYSVDGIADWDFNHAYRTSRIMHPQFNVKNIDDSSTMEVTVNCQFGDRFLKRKKDITAFRITIVFLFPDFKSNEIITTPFVLPDKLLTDKTPISFIVQPPGKASSYLACFKAQACAKGVLIESSFNTDKAMCLVGSGFLN